MAAKQYDFSIEQGSSFRLSLTYKDANDAIIDLTGYCARLTLKVSNNEYKVFTTLNNDYSEYKFVIDAAQGGLTLLLPASTTNNYTFSNAKYDLELQSPVDLYNGGGKQTIRVLYGTISIVKRFSQSTTLLDCTI
ncbi:hypothetical protein EBQ81_05060 [bacterium]|nr:hypothetical protein [bacterium]